MIQTLRFGNGYRGFKFTMKKDMYLYCVIFAVFFKLPHVYTAKFSDVLGNGPKQHNLSCENGAAIEITRGLQLFGKNYRKCDYQNHSCQWLPESPTQRFCSLGDHIKAAFSCDGQKSCNTNSPDDPGIRCCKANNDCENRLGYKIEYKCVPGLKKLNLNPNQKEFSISGKDIIIKAPFDSNRNCSCLVVTEPTGVVNYNYYSHSENHNIITGYINFKSEKTFSFHGNRNVSIILKTVLSGSQENESILKVTCSCSYDVNHIQTVTARATSRPMLKSEVFTSTKSSVETQENSGDISVSEDVDHSKTPTSRPKSTVFTSTQSGVETQENSGDITVSEGGNNMVMIITVVGVGLLLVVILVVVVSLVKKRTARTTIQTTNSNSDGEPIRERATVPVDDGYISLNENRNDNSGIIIHQETINNVIVGGGNYHHIVPAGSQLQNDSEGNYNHVAPAGSQLQNDFDDYNHIGDLRGNNSVADVGDYDHVGRCVPQAQGNDRDDRRRSQENKYKKEDVTYAAVNKKDNPGRPKSTKDESVVGYKAHAKGGNSTTEDVEYAVVKKDGARK